MLASCPVGTGSACSNQLLVNIVVITLSVIFMPDARACMSPACIVRLAIQAQTGHSCGNANATNTISTTMTIMTAL